MDFDKFYDPNFNPFATKKAMQNSPPATPVEKREAEPKIPVEPVEKLKPETGGELPVEPTVSSEAQEMKAKTERRGADGRI